MQAWNEFLIKKEKALGLITVQKWLRTLKVINFDAGNLYLEALDSFQALWFKEHIYATLHSEFKNENGRPIKVHLSIANEKHSPQIPFIMHEKKDRQDTKHSEGQLNPFLSIQSYIPTKENIVPYKLICELISYNPEKEKYDKKLTPFTTYNPIFLHGVSGSGKTHLLTSIAHGYKRLKKHVLYTKAISFTEGMVHAIRMGEMQSFRMKHRNIDVLIIDDIDIFSKKLATQEELFHTFNTLHVQGKQIILSSLLPPYELKDIEPRLTSRFEWGIVLPLKTPKKEYTEAILQSKLNLYNCSLTPDVFNYITTNFSSNPSLLDKAVNALMLRSHLKRPSSQHLTLPEAAELLKDLLEEKKRNALDSKKIINSVALYFGVPVHDILSTSRSRDCLIPRKVAMFLCRKKLFLPFMKIGKVFSRDHSTVMSSIKQVEKSLKSKDQEYTLATNTILKTLNTSL